MNFNNPRQSLQSGIAPVATSVDSCGGNCRSRMRRGLVIPAQAAVFVIPAQAAVFVIPAQAGIQFHALLSKH